MVKLIIKQRYKFFLGLFIVLLCVVGFMLQIKRILAYDNPRAGTLMIVTFFTNHANLFVFISTILLLLNITNKHLDRFLFISTVDITITCVVFFTILLPFMPEVTFLQILLHGIIPPLFITYYFISATTTVHRKASWISLIHPFLYFIFVFTIAHPIYGNYLYRLFPLEVDSYIYPFLNPAYFNKGLVGMILVNYLLLFPTAYLLSFVILLFKQRIDDKKTIKKSTSF